ncbi:hypothetical protein A2592_01045 [Candidatus Kaiserbacteria bacterium RIFOXYD1_FULL_42_15]|uniref:Uncharacterized protein n=1 Tax=Candidatus Kaiserbacteria bacterium RIFOXYD1_FULL_42_15 TaxID=1798532 RepID=A0A1F6FQ57_9BACT|nr:MAG: hypothetical protein A2592_01045 [Candidatus Kaiserbacteria bacterium RIFOXYD1_FULL_42_15]
MRIFWLVIKDLFQFVFGFTDTKFNTAITPRMDILPIRPLTRLEKLNPQTLSSNNVITQPERMDMDEAKSELLYEPTIMYVCEPDGSIFLGAPHEEFDMVIDNFLYGTAVTVLSFKGRYARVWKSNNEGWVLKDVLTPDKNSVWPSLISGMVYDCGADETKKIRVLISDIFNAGRFSLSLQPGEYILYRLMTDNRQIVWTSIRPRTPGTWQQILRGKNGIHMSVSPKADSIMEWVNESGEGYLAYVEFVSPENTLALTSVGLTEIGIFTELVMAESVWRELRPVFIEVV